jgi:hypothetical protein
MRKSQELLLKSLEQIPSAEELPVKVLGLVTDFKAIVDPKTKKTFSIVSKEYQLIQHKDVWKAVSKNKKFSIGEASIYKNGRVMMITLIPKQEVKIELIPNSKDYITPYVRVFNSYDATRALAVQSFGMRLICTNGAVAPGLTDRYHKPHAFKNIVLADLDKQVDLALETWKLSGRTLQAAYKFKVDTQVAIREVGKFPKKYKDKASQLLKKQDTLYNVWNALTNVLSHEMKGNVQSSTLVKYQTRVNRVFNLLNEPTTDPVLRERRPALESEEEED